MSNVPEVKCSICGAKKNWPIVPAATGEQASARPTHCGSIYPRSGELDREDLLTFFEQAEEVAHYPEVYHFTSEVSFATVCPRCMRMGDTAESNGYSLMAVACDHYQRLRVPIISPEGKVVGTIVPRKFMRISGLDAEFIVSVVEHDYMILEGISNFKDIRVVYQGAYITTDELEFWDNSEAHRQMKNEITISTRTGKNGESPLIIMFDEVEKVASHAWGRQLMDLCIRKNGKAYTESSMDVGALSEGVRNFDREWEKGESAFDFNGDLSWAV